MIKKTRLSFSSISIEPARNATQREAGKDKKPTHNPTQGDFGTENRLHTKPAHRPADKKRTSKSSTYQYAKKGHGHGGGDSEPMAGNKLAIMFGVAAALFWLIGSSAPKEFLSHFTVFVLACFVGYMVVWNVKPALHTPLMSVTNAISSIIAIGALVQISPMANATERPNTLIIGLAALALVLTAINMFGGFAVTQRMLAMFRK